MYVVFTCTKKAKNPLWTGLTVVWWEMVILPHCFHCSVNSRLFSDWYLGTLKIITVKQSIHYECTHGTCRCMNQEHPMSMFFKWSKITINKQCFEYKFMFYLKTILNYVLLLLGSWLKCSTDMNWNCPMYMYCHCSFDMLSWVL